jgi:hypothetical protein
LACLDLGCIVPESPSPLDINDIIDIEGPDA